MFMKKLGFLTSVLTILLMASCSNKTRSEEITADSTQMDSVMVADDDSYDIWTVEAVDAQIRACFDEVNKKAADYPIDIIGLDKMFCSKEFLELEERLTSEINVK
jgi:thiamine biosynthesis lipoprotein ApbE